MTNDTNERIYRKLLLFFNASSVIHFKINSGEFRNGIIRTLDNENSVMIIKEFKLGNISVLFEDIIEDSICEYNNRGEGDGSRKF